MTQISMRHALAAGASLAVLTLAVMTAANLQTIENLRWRNEPEPVSLPPGAPMLRDLTKEAATQEPLRREDMSKDTRAKDAEKPATASAAGRHRGGAGCGDAAAAPADTEAAAAVSPPAPMLGRQDALASNMAAPAGQPLAADAAGEVAMLAEPPPPAVYHDEGRDKFQTIATNPLKVTAEDPFRPSRSTSTRRPIPSCAHR
jgi:hypothetical protein